MTVTWGSLLRQDFIEVQQHEAKARPCGVLGGIEFRIRFEFADLQELCDFGCDLWAEFSELDFQHGEFV